MQQGDGFTKEYARLHHCTTRSSVKMFLSIYVDIKIESTCGVNFISHYDEFPGFFHVIKPTELGLCILNCKVITNITYK